MDDWSEIWNATKIANNEKPKGWKEHDILRLKQMSEDLKKTGKIYWNPDKRKYEYLSKREEYVSRYKEQGRLCYDPKNVRWEFVSEEEAEKRKLEKTLIRNSNENRWDKTGI